MSATLINRRRSTRFGREALGVVLGAGVVVLGLLTSTVAAASGATPAEAGDGHRFAKAVSPIVAPRVDVAVVGDSMFALGQDAIQAALEDDDTTHLIEYAAESGTTIRTNGQLDRIITADPDVLVLSFQINDVSGHGVDEALAGFDDLLDRADHIDCIRWVTFYDNGLWGDVVEGLSELADEYPNTEVVAFHEVLGDNAEWRYPPDTLYGGDIHMDPAKPGPAAMGKMIAESIDCPARQR